MQRTSPFIAAIAATVILLGLYFSVLTIVSGWGFTIEQFGAFWPYILPLSFGFGIQVGLFTHLRNLSLKHHHATHVLNDATRHLAEVMMNRSVREALAGKSVEDV